MELGTSAKMLSIVPLMNGGGLFETGAGGSAPKHVQQFVKENHLRWDSLGEFLALAASLEFLAQSHRQRDRAAARRHARPRHGLGAEREPVAGAQGARARQPRQPLLPGALLGPGVGAADRRPRPSAAKFAPIAEALAANEDRSSSELNEVQGSPVDIGGYYSPTRSWSIAAMRPSADLQLGHRRHLSRVPSVASSNAVPRRAIGHRRRRRDGRRRAPCCSPS